MRIDCHVPITVRIVGVPTDDQLAAVGQALTRAVSARLAEAERVLAERHGDPRGATTEVRERYDPGRQGADGYAVPSFQLAGDPVAVPALPDLSANEAEALRVRSAGPNLVDPTRSAADNEAAVRALALDIFGSREAVEAVFASLSPLVRQEVDRQHPPEGADATADHHLQFFIRMRLYFSTWEDLLDHFRNFTEVKRPATQDNPEVDVVLHRDAADRLERVLNLLPKHPKIYGGFQLRHFEEGEIQTPGFMIHALGYALDIAAAENPKIGFQSSGTRRFDPHQIAAAIDPRGAHMDMGNDWPGIVKAMGQRLAADTTTLAADDQDPVAKRVFQLFEQQFRQMQRGSLGFIGTLSPAHRTKLLDVRKRYLDVLREIAAQRGKQTPASLQERRKAILEEIPPLVTEWITALDTEVKASLAKHPGMDKLRPPAEIRADLQHAEKRLQLAQQDEQRAKTATAAAVRRRDAAIAKTRPVGRDWTPAPVEAIRDAAARRQEAETALREEIYAKRVRDSAAATRDRLKAELAASDVPALRPAWKWITEVTELREELAHPDLSTPAGIGTFEALTTGDLRSIAPADNPPLLRLLEAGFFNPKDGFDLRFFAEMAHSGFVPGATWQFGGADPMHFELQEGRERIKPPGTLPPRAH
ncbi:hypothetical protein [Amycolatopsis sp. NPDC004169]|uniref:hypothetical protein n=1 Tax=Amycolatopsis sp. NPDC004169 TaxID=3154453 RepID=UPI0033AC7569